jgi:hypothetical protein
MPDTCDSLIRQCMGYCDRLIYLAEKGMSTCDEEMCMVFFGIMLDSAYKLKSAGEMRCNKGGDVKHRRGKHNKETIGYSQATDLDGRREYV